MILKKIKITNFRCHEEFELVFDKKTTMILGENGCGKTSILEAIFEVLRGKSFKAVDNDILRRGSDFYRIEVDYENGEKTIVTFNGEKKEFIAGGKKTGRLPKKYRYPIILFEPSDLVLIGASPTHKRNYFDRSFSQLDESYGVALNKYNRALKQRNELLKQDFVLKDSLFSWNVMLAKYGVEITKIRNVFIEEINKNISNIYQTIAKNKDTVYLNYETQVECDESKYLKIIDECFEKDKILGYTTFGIHKDNYNFWFNNSLADSSASRGELRSIILALKFIEAKQILEKLNKQPLILLDDVFSELDEIRQKSLTSNFKSNQVIITSVNQVNQDNIR